MNSCKNCAYRVYDTQRGVYKCQIHNHVIRDVDRYLNCENHEKKAGEKK